MGSVVVVSTPQQDWLEILAGLDRQAAWRHRSPDQATLIEREAYLTYGDCPFATAGERWRVQPELAGAGL